MVDRYTTFSRDEWSRLRAATPLTLGVDDLDQLLGINEQIDLDEVATVYLPLSRLLNLYVSAVQDLHRVSSTFLGDMAPKVPYVIGVAGSVAVGKSTFSRVLQALLGRWPDHPKVDLVTTDGFLYPNAELAARGLMERKGFPESFDTRGLLEFLRAVKSGAPRAIAPVYDHVVYDIVDDRTVVVENPDIVIVEGLNVLQVDRDGTEFVSDYFDFSIYIDADPAHIEEWYVQRFFTLRNSVFTRPESYFRNFAGLDDTAAEQMAVSGNASTARTCAATSNPPATGQGWCCAKARITEWNRCGSANSDRHRGADQAWPASQAGTSRIEPSSA